METDLQNTLKEKYPHMFQNCDKTPMQSCMAFGIECGDGWYQIISDLCFLINQHENNIESQNKYKTSQDPEFEPESYTKVTFDQIKEKFGGLRVYFSGGDEYVRGVVSMAESVSYRVCEVCGNKGKANKGGWIMVLCEECDKKR